MEHNQDENPIQRFVDIIHTAIFEDSASAADNLVGYIEIWRSLHRIQVSKRNLFVFASL